MKKRLRLILADYHTLFRQGLKALFATMADFKVVGETGRVNELKNLLASHRCDVLVLELQMDEWVMQEIRGLSRGTAVVVLTATEDPKNIAAAIALGASAVVQKRFALETLISAIHAAAEGFIWLPPATGDGLGHCPGYRASTYRLTQRESTIVQCVVEGMRNAEVAEKLAISKGTVNAHLYRIYHKLAVHDRVELVHYALRSGLLQAGVATPRRKYSKHKYKKRSL